jgi:hypothetical protein
MNKSLCLLAIPLLFLACTKEDLEPTIVKDEIQAREGHPVSVCHQKGNGDWEVLNVSINALNAHLGHGDVELIDADGDGFVIAENECIPGGDCDDDNASVYPGAEEICGDGIDNNCDNAIDEGCVTPCWEAVLDEFDFSNWGLVIGLEDTPELEFIYFYINSISNRFCVDDSEIDFISIEADKFSGGAICGYGIDGQSFFTNISKEEGDLINAALLQLAAENNIPRALDVECGSSFNADDLSAFLLEQLPEHLKSKITTDSYLGR